MIPPIFPGENRWTATDLPICLEIGPFRPPRRAPNSRGAGTGRRRRRGGCAPAVEKRGEGLEGPGPPEAGPPEAGMAVHPGA